MLGYMCSLGYTVIFANKCNKEKSIHTTVGGETVLYPSNSGWTNNTRQVSSRKSLIACIHLLHIKGETQENSNSPKWRKPP